MARQYLNLAQIYGAVDQSRANQANLENNRLQQQQLQMQMEEAQRQRQEQDSVRGIYRGAIETDESGMPKLNEKRLISELYGVAPEKALETQQTFTQRDAAAQKLQSETKKAELAYKVDAAKYARDRLAGVTDQQGYEAVMGELAEVAPALVKSAPPEFNPQWKDQQIFTADDWIKKGENELNRGVTMRGQDITLRGQDMTDSRMRSEGALNRGVTMRGQNLTDSRAATGGTQKPLPATALKMQTEALDKLSVASNINTDLNAIEQQINSGKLSFGPIKNLTNTGLNMAGMSTEESRNFATFKSTLEKLRNDSLRLNTGVQTDGDAQRAWNELFQNINDTKFVQQRLGEIRKINERGADLQKLQVDNIRMNYNAPPIDYSKYQGAKPALGNGASGSFEAPSAAKPLTVTAPNGKVYSFKSQAAANEFKRKAGIK